MPDVAAPETTRGPEAIEPGVERSMRINGCERAVAFAVFARR